MSNAALTKSPFWISPSFSQFRKKRDRNRSDIWVVKRRPGKPNKSVGVCIETFNPSRDFFAKRGFEVVSDDGANLRMRWTQ